MPSLKKAESSQVSGHHAPITDDLHDRSLRRHGRKTVGNTAGGRVSIRSRRRNVDLASKIKEKCEKTGHHSPKKIGEGQPPPNLARGNKSSTSLEVGKKLTPLDQPRGNKKHPDSRGARGKSPPKGARKA